MWSSIVIILSFTTAVLSSIKSTKNYITFGGFICSREENLIGPCLKDVFNNYIPKLIIGLPDYNIPTCEPLQVRPFTIKHTDGPVSVDAAFSNMYVKGIATMRVRNVVIDTKDHKLIVDLHIPELKMLGEYKWQGTIVMEPVEEDGDFTSKYNDVNATVTLNLGRKKILQGPDVLTCEKLDVKFHVDEASIDMRNHAGYDTELNKAMKNFIQESWQNLSEEVQIPIEMALTYYLKPLADRTLPALDADDIFILLRNTT